MLPPTIATLDGLVASGEEVPDFATTTAPLFVCACVFFVIVPVALQALVNLNKALRLYVIGGDGRVEHHDPAGDEFLSLFRRGASDLDDPRFGRFVNVNYSDIVFGCYFRLNGLTRSWRDCLVDLFGHDRAFCLGFRGRNGFEALSSELSLAG